MWEMHDEDGVFYGVKDPALDGALRQAQELFRTHGHVRMLVLSHYSTPVIRLVRYVEGDAQMFLIV